MLCLGYLERHFLLESCLLFVDSNGFLWSFSVLPGSLFAISAHFFPIFAWASIRILSSSLLHMYFLLESCLLFVDSNGFFTEFSVLPGSLFAISAHFFPISAWTSIRILSSSLLHMYFCVSKTAPVIYDSTSICIYRCWSMVGWKYS